MVGKELSDAKIQSKIDSMLTSLPPFISAWVTNMRVSKKTRKTCLTYLEKVGYMIRNYYTDPLSVKPEDINSDIIEAYLLSLQTVNGRRASDSNQASGWYAINCLCSYLVKSKKIDYNPMDIIDRPKQHDRARIQEEAIYIETRHIRKILDYIKTNEKDEFAKKRNLAIIRLLSSVGIRERAFLNITLDDIDFDKNSIRVIDKGEKYRVVAFGGETAACLKEWIDERNKYSISRDPHLFITKDGTQMSKEALIYTTKHNSEKAIGIKLSPHKFRAFYGTTIYNKTGDIVLTRNALGHSSVSTTQLYIRKDKGEIKRTVNIMESVLD